MEFRSPEFKTRAVHALHDANLQKALSNTKAGFVVKRAKAAEEMPEFEALRDTAAEIKNHVLANIHSEVFSPQNNLCQGCRIT